MSFATSRNSLYLGQNMLAFSGLQNVKSNFFFRRIPLTSCCVLGQHIPKRTLFNTSNKKEYHGRKLVGYRMDQLFDVVSDVENYHKFVPWCKKSYVKSRTESNLKADLIIGFPPINEKYTSDVFLVKPYLVKAECTEGRLFNYLLTLWRFSPGLNSNPNTCVIDFRVMFQFKSIFHSHLANIFFEQVVVQMEGAFLTETTRRFGRASRQLEILQTTGVNS